MLVVVYLILQHLQSVELGGRSVADGSPTVTLVFGNILSRASRVLSLNSLYVGMVGKEGVALGKSHGMRMNLGDCRPIIIGQTTDAMLYVEFMLTHHRGTRLAQQLVVVQQTSGYRILYCRHAYHGRIATHILVYLLEGGTTDELYLFATEVLMGGDIVE